MIKCLPEEVQARLRSGVVINSVGHCVEELILNSIDANATCIAIRVDLETFKVQVVDNGCGMRQEDLNKAGTRYFTSKCCSLEDLENLKFYGFRGEALASIANMASILEISSKTNKIAKTSLKLFHQGKSLEVSEAELNRPSLGTTVSVYNLFHQLPVRRKCMDSTLEFEKVKHKVEALSLIHPSVSFSLRNEASCSMVLQLPKTKDMCSRFSQIYGLGRSQKLREINHMSDGFEIGGFISSEGHYNKNIQFLYINNRLVLKTKLHKLIDFLLRKQSVICKTKRKTLLSSPSRHRSGPELYGVFIINVKCQYDEYDVCLEPAKTLIEFRRWDDLLTCLEEGVKNFLKQEHLFIELCYEDIKEFNENNGFCLGNIIAIKPSLPKEKGMQESFKTACDNIVDSYEIFNLQSKPVKRKETLTKKISDHIEPSNVVGVHVYSDLTGSEPVHESRHNKVNFQPNKNDTVSEIPKFNKFQEESELSFHSQIEVMNAKCPEELGRQDKLVASEIDNCVGTLLGTEKYEKSVTSQKDKGVQEKNPDSAIMGCTEFVEHVDEFNNKCIVGLSSMEKYKSLKKDQELSVGLNTTTELTTGHEPLKLCSTGSMTDLIQNHPLPKITEMNRSLNKQFKLSSVIAKDMFEKKLGTSGQIPNPQEYVSVTNRIPTGNTNEQLKDVSTSLLADGTMDSVVSHVKKCMPVVPAESDNHLGGINNSRQITQLSVRPQYYSLTKLSWHPKLGSLDRFRKYYGNIKNNSSKSCTEVKNNEAEACFKSVTDENTELQNSNIFEIPANKYDVSNNSGYTCLPLERSQYSKEETLSNRKALNISPCKKYSQIKNQSLSGCKFTRTLAFKVSRMKDSVKDVVSSKSTEKLLAQTQICSSPGDKSIQDLTPQNIHLQSSCQKPQQSPSLREETESNCLPSASDVEDNSMGMCNTRANVDGTVSLCFIDTDGEYIASQNKQSVLCNKKMDFEGSCEDKGIVGAVTKQVGKSYELQRVNSPRNMEYTTDDSSAIHSKEPQSSPSKWWYQFDASLGRTVYVNKTSGLSSYNAPPSEEVQATCTQDLSTIAVNVLEKGFQSRCHPFRSEVIEPFLPRMQKESSLERQDFRVIQESLQELFSEWDNPVFAQCPKVALDVSSGQADTLAVKIHNILYPYQFTKKMIDSVQVLNQVDNKFIACLINTRADENERTDGNLLVLVDQHAAHERVRLEQLITDSYDKQHDALGKKKLLASTLYPPLEVEVSEDQRRLLWCCRKSLENLGLELNFPMNNPSQILVGKVPLCFVEREANELRRGRHTVTKTIVQELIQEQIELLQETGVAQGMLPLTIMKVLASQACHGAVKFNDILTLEESCHLMASLACCQLPFQCAHGRPSMLPLADVDHLQQESQPKPNLVKLRKMVKAWQLFGKEKESTVKAQASADL